MNVDSPHLESTDDEKEAFYMQLKREYDNCPKYNVKIVLGDLLGWKRRRHTHQQSEVSAFTS